MRTPQPILSRGRPCTSNGAVGRAASSNTASKVSAATDQMGAGAHTTRQDDLIDSAFQRRHQMRPSLLDGLHKFHRTLFKVRSEYLPARGKVLFIAIEFRRHQEIEPTVFDFLRRGLDLRGLEVFEKDDENHKVWLGTVRRSDSAGIVVQGDDVERSIDGKMQWIEPSSDAFQTIFVQALGQAKYDLFVEAEWAQSSEELCGKGYVARLEQVAQHLRRAGVLELIPGLHASFGAIIGLRENTRPPSARSPRSCPYEARTRPLRRPPCTPIG